jgi:hypothetical protein
VNQVLKENTALKPIKYKDEPMVIFRQQFYRKFVYSDSNTSGKSKSLKDVFGEEVHNMFVFGAHTQYINSKGNPVFKYSAMNNSLSFLPWLDNVPIDEKVFFEYIINNMMKFCVDIDVSIELGKYFDQEYINVLIERIIDAYTKIVGPLDLERDVLLCSSNGPNKFSYHLIFINSMFHYEDCKKIRELIVQDLSLDEIERSKIVDPNIYKNGQQFRFLYNQKSGRIKQVADIKYKDRIIKHIPRIQPYGNNEQEKDNHLRQILFLESLVGYRHSPEINNRALESSLIKEIQRSQFKPRRNSDLENNKYDLTINDFDEIVSNISNFDWMSQFNVIGYERGEVKLS